MSRILAVTLVMGSIVLAAPTAVGARTETSRPTLEETIAEGPTLGWETTPAGAAEPLPPEVEGRLVVRIEADWAAIETGPGRFDWSSTVEAARAWDRAGAVVVLALTGAHPAHVTGNGPPSPYEAGAVEAWVAFVRSAVVAMAGRAAVFEIAPGAVDRPVDPDVDAYVLKTSAIGIRAAARAAGVDARVAQRPAAGDDLDRQRRLWDAGVAPYVDVLPIRVAPGGDVARTVEGFREAALAYPPAAAPWAYVDGPKAPARALTALAAGASVAVVRPHNATADVALARWAVGVQGALAEGFAPAPAEAVRLTDASGAGDSRARLVATYFSDRSFETLLVIDPGGARTDEEPLMVVVPSAYVRNARAIDPAAGVTRRIAARAVDGDDRSRSLAIAASGEAPVLVRYQSAAPLPEGIQAPEEQLEVERSRGLTAQEIIARHQEVQRRQDDRLDRWTARAQVDFHFRFAQGGPTVDVTILSNYFWERGGNLEWEQTEYYVNGNKVRWKNIPELPLIQPEKVVTLPLDLTLDKTYAYTLAGEEVVGDRPAYVLEFTPSAPEAATSLYRGRVWIDRETFVRLKANVVQTGLDVPVLSNEEVDRYRPIPGPGDETFWMLAEIDGQQVWNAAGRNFVVRREVRFLEFDINPERDAFVARRDRAYASDNQMLRDTDEGFRYLRREDDGTRTVKTGVDSSQLFALAGAFKDNSTDGVVPLAGVNWFDYRLGGRDVQANVFFAGALGFGTLTLPDVLDSGFDVTLDAGFSAIKTDDKVFRAGEEDEALRLRRRTQRSALRVGRPIGSFFKVNVVAGLDYREYDDSSDAARARPAGTRFVLPEDHRETSIGTELLFNRRGWELAADYEWARRSSWSPWGLFDDGAGAFVDPEYDPRHQSFETWSVSLRREWFLPRFQKIRAEIAQLGGSDLDRFSEYQFGFFGDDRLFGFSGSGVRFDRGTIVRAGYLFNLFEVIRFQSSVETARVRDARDAGDDQSHTGVGLSANFIGPWKTVLNLDVGYALASDVPELEGDVEALLVILKLF